MFVDASYLFNFNHLPTDSLSSDKLWEFLSPSERTQFLKMIQDPSSEAARSLLRTKELEEELSKEIIAPWWEASLTMDEDNVPAGDSGWKVRLSKRYGSAPEVMSIPASMLNSRPPTKGGDQPTQILLYNICAVL